MIADALADLHMDLGDFQPPLGSSWNQSHAR